jgi:hypothetical protein
MVFPNKISPRRWDMYSVSITPPNSPASEMSNRILMNSGMDYDPFRPHWTHRNCGGIVTGVGDLFKCLKCKATGSAVGAFLPANVVNSTGHFACNPELEVQFVDPKEPLTSQLVLFADGRNRWQVRENLRRLMWWRSTSA